MRQIISTAVVAVVVGAVAGATMGAVAQPGPEAPAQQAIVPAVRSINANKVDGKHAVGAKASRAKRRGKLVATNKRGYLPSNIIKPAWSLMLGKPAAFADGQIGWGEVQGKPPGFADGVDNVGVTKVRVVRVRSGYHLYTPGSSYGVSATCPPGTVVIGGGASNTGTMRLVDSVSDSDGWAAYYVNDTGSSSSAEVVAHCLSVEPAARLEVAGKRKAGPAAKKGR